MFAYGDKMLKLCSGVMLPELMAGIVIAMLIMGILLENYVVSQNSNELRRSLNQIQHSAKSALNLLSDDIRRSGYIGCARLKKGFAIPSEGSHSLTYENRFLVHQKNKITVRYAAYSGVMLNKVMDNGLLYTSSEVKFSPGDSLIISDCKQAEILKAKAIYFNNEAQKIVPEHPLHYAYSSFAEISKLEVNTYFVGKTNRKNTKGDVINALYLEDIKGRKTELVEGVQDLKMEVDEGDAVTGVSMTLELMALTTKKKSYGYVAF